ncbi:MAG: carbohydrate-binding protein [Clostridia bacterium]|nr:carbohydrate-binding protein [Clostridia bacterium]
MELIKNIFFNTDKLIQNTKVKISYTGLFFENDSKEVYIHYGFGAFWDNLSEIKMEKTELGFQAEIDLLESETFNFCFKNENNEWDNNCYQNYIFPLESQTLDLTIIDDTASSLDRPNRLKKAYLWSKKIRLTIYKIITYVPKLISGNYKKKLNNNN